MVELSLLCIARIQPGYMTVYLGIVKSCVIGVFNVVVLVVYAGEIDGDVVVGVWR